MVVVVEGFAPGEGGPEAEIAAVVGATPKAVETRIYRARDKLRAPLKRWL